MVVICLGPICVPIWPIVALAAKPIWDKLIPNSIKVYLAKTWTRCCHRKKRDSKKISKITCATKAFSSEQEFQDRLQQPKPFLVKFTAQWCGPCQKISPFVDSLASKHPNLDFFQVDIDHLDDLALSLGVVSIPAFHIYHKGQKLEQFIGANPDRLQKMIESIKIVD